MLQRHLARTVNPNGGVVYGRVVEEHFSNDQLLERILSTENIKLAWKQVRANKGAPGIDGITVENFPLPFSFTCISEVHVIIRGDLYSMQYEIISSETSGGFPVYKHPGPDKK